MPPIRETLSFRQTAMQLPRRVVTIVSGSDTTQCSPWMMLILRMASGQRAEDALNLFLEGSRRKRLYDIVVDAEGCRLLYKIAVRRTGQHDKDGLPDHRVGPDLLEKLESVHFGHVVIGNDEMNPVAA